jgi:uncharacterized protein (DUF1501 family)
MRRRDFIKLLAALPVSAMACNNYKFNNSLHSLYSTCITPSLPKNKTIILVELAGGFDGLGIFIPKSQYGTYRDLRPTLGEKEKDVIHLAGDTLLNTRLFEKIYPIFEAGDMAILNGVGYPNPSLSHFKSRDVWNYGVDVDSNNHDTGWATRFLSNIEKKPLMGSILDNNAEPFKGQTDSIMHFKSPVSLFGSNSGRYDDVQNFYNRLDTTPSNIDILPKKNESLKSIISSLSGKIKGGNINYSNPYEYQMKQALELSILPDKYRPNIIKVGFDVFDTHQNQKDFDDSYIELADSLLKLSRALIENNRWDDTLIYAYSEFGRTPYENGASGTEHNNANNLFVMGGSVNGGVYGQYPSLSSYKREDIMIGDIDFRSVYSTIFKNFMSSNDPVFSDSSIDIKLMNFIGKI